MMLVVALVAFACSLVVIHGSYMRRFLVRQEIEKLALLCRSMSAAAMMENTKKTLTFDRSGRSYSHDGIREKFPLSVDFGVVPGAKGPPSDLTHEITSAITFAGNAIVFHPDGVIQPGAVYLVSNDREIMYALSCAVAKVSYLRLYRYDGSWHCLT